MDNSLSPADITALTGNNGGWEGLIFLFAILCLFGGGGFGFGGNTNALNADMQRGFDTQNLNAQTSAILGAVNNGTAQTVAATNQTFHDSLMANQNLYNEISRDISSVQLGLSNLLANQNECCCSTKMLIQETSAQNRYDNLLNTQKILDALSQNKIEAMQAQINKLQLEQTIGQATAGMIKFPNTWSYDAGQFPPFVVGA